MVATSCPACMIRLRNGSAPGIAVKHVAQVLQEAYEAADQMAGRPTAGMSSAFRLRQVDLIFVVAALAVVVGVTMLPSPRDRNPMVPADADHRALIGEKDCLNCHVQAGSRPLPVKHTKAARLFSLPRETIAGVS